MKVNQRSVLLLTVGICALGLPRSLPAITGCSNTLLSGTYNAQISSLPLQNLILAIGGATGGSTSATNATSSGFVNSSNSLSGKTPGLGRYFFDGTGNIVGQMTTGNRSMSTVVGTYSVSDDCTATLKLNTGET